MVVIALVVGHHIVHVNDGEFVHRVSLSPGAGAAGPAKAADAAIVAVFLSHEGSEAETVAVAGQIIIGEVGEDLIAQLVLMEHIDRALGEVSLALVGAAVGQHLHEHGEVVR